MIIKKYKTEILNTDDEMELLEFMIDNKHIKNFFKLIESTKINIRQYINYKDVRNIKEAVIDFKKIFSGTTNQQRYWCTRGYTKYEANDIISENAKKAAKKAAEQLKEIISDPIRHKKLKESKTTSIKYYLEKGMNQKEATLALKERQSTFSKKKMIDKYGEEEGLDRVQKRNDKWMKSLKTNNDWDKLSKSKAVTLEKMIKKYGEDEGTEKYNNWKDSVAQTKTNFIKRYGEIEGTEKWELFKDKFIINYQKASQQSIDFFTPILEFCMHKIDNDDIFIGMDNSSEYWLKSDNKTFFYDLTIRSLDLIVEFHGTHIHPNPKWNKDKLSRWKHAFKDLDATDARDNDIFKNKIAENMGFTVIEVWNDDKLSIHQTSIINEISRRLL